MSNIIMPTVNVKKVVRERKLLKGAKRVVLMAGDKGGPGKSTTAGGFIEFCLKHDIRPLVIETDKTVTDVGPPYANIGLPVIYLNMRKKAAYDEIADILARGEHEIIVINGTASLNETMNVHGWMLREAIEETKYQLDVFWVLNTQGLGLELLVDFWPQFPDAMINVVCNLKYAEDEDKSQFSVYLASEARKRVEAQGHTLWLPVGAMAVMNAYVDRQITFGTQAEKGEPLSQRLKARDWLRQTNEMFAKVYR